ncbi:phosphoglycerate mutase [Litorimonas cladophorae]|uniref:Phosphoglycerate mutase n=1 Tax=Litorimonas cladophorae TaxID=1220491 RepID=A0A918KET9_9PROT|nr:histidine phosphatase family protein [Litorimonas cladophorae]GGX60109.1 phosphoglycerate mutase [Litorimonas cladophorae]
MLSRLLLMRHAKSSWSDGGQSDHERPLNDRGRRAATAVGAALTARKFAPDTIWSSDSKRTRETAMRLIRAIPGGQTVNYTPEFYHAGVETVLRVCGQHVEPDGALMLLGHNPGWAELHTYFTGQYIDYPTGACTVLTRKAGGQSDWLAPSAWAFTALILPRELEV